MSNPGSDIHVDINQTVLWEVQLAFEGQWVLAFLIFIAATVLICLRQREGAKVLPLWAIFAAQLSFLLIAIFRTVAISRSLQAALGYSTDSGSWSTPSAARLFTQLAFEQLFRALAAPLTFCIFYNVIHLVLGALSKVENPYGKTRIFHWSCLALISAYSLVIWCLEAATYGYESKEEYERANRILRSAPYIQSAYYIVLWLAAWENMGWTIFLAIKTVRSRARLMLPSMFLLFGGMFWFAMNFLSALFVIVYTLNPTTRRTTTGITSLGSTVITVLTIIMSIASWTGIILFCFRFVSVQKEGVEPYQVQNIGNWTETSHLSPPSPVTQRDYHSSLQEGYRKLAAEADSSTVIGEMEAGHLCHEADAERPIHEVDGVKPKSPCSRDKGSENGNT